MQLTEEKRKLLKTLMAIQGVSARKLAYEGAGWKAHSYMNRLLNGDVSTLDSDAATRIAIYLGADVTGPHGLFVARATNEPAQYAHRQRTAA